MYKGLDLRFEYVIRLSNGQYWTYDYCPGYRSAAYTFTEHGAYSKIKSMKNSQEWGYLFVDAVVERV